jgi:hypothetical protein
VAKNSILILLVLLLVGCSSYSKMGIVGPGYDETWINNTVVDVIYRGNGFTSAEKAKNYTLLRSAELALEKGYGFFQVLDEQYYFKETYLAPSTHVRTRVGSPIGYDYKYGTGMIPITTTVTQTAGSTVKKPRTWVRIKLMQSPSSSLSTGGDIYNATYICKRITTEYGVSDAECMVGLSDPSNSTTESFNLKEVVSNEKAESVEPVAPSGGFHASTDPVFDIEVMRTRYGNSWDGYFVKSWYGDGEDIAAMIAILRDESFYGSAEVEGDSKYVELGSKYNMKAIDACLASTLLTRKKDVPAKVLCTKECLMTTVLKDIALTDKDEERLQVGIYEFIDTFKCSP